MREIFTAVPILPTQKDLTNRTNTDLIMRRGLERD